jgi:hypothetical protein
LRALQLAQQMPQPVILRQRPVALGDRGVTFGPRRRQQRLQRFDTQAAEVQCRSRAELNQIRAPL